MSSAVPADSPGAPLPRNYATILEAVRNAADGMHLSTHDVYVSARNMQPKLGYATVHRGLIRLCELGYVSKVDIPGAASAIYECATSPHAHFRCMSCGAISDVEFSVPQALLATLAARHGLQITAESTTFAGRCAHCTAEPKGRLQTANA